MRTVILVMAIFLASAASARAMEIRAYDSLSSTDQNRYMAHLVSNAIHQLETEQKKDMALKLRKLFLDPVNGKDPEGFKKLHHDLGLMREIDAKRGPNSERVHVEHALLYVLKQNGIDAPKDVMLLTQDFKPTGK